MKKKRFIDPRWLLAAGVVVSVLSTYAVVANSASPGFEILRITTAEFWHGSVPYGEKGDGLFMYGPLFSVIFTPFALLPARLAPYLWNVFNMCLLFLAVFSLPDSIRTEQKCRFFLFLLPLAFISQLSFRFDMATVYFALFAFSLLERGFYKWGITVILVSAFSGVYGAAQLLTLPFYPRFWKNAGFAVVVALLFSAVPLAGFSLSSLGVFYQAWFASVSACEFSQPFYTVFYLEPFFPDLPAWSMTARIVSAAVLLIIILACRKRFGFFAFRAGATGVLLGWAVLFGMVSTASTYLIAFAGFLLWYYGKTQVSAMDRVFLWCNFIVLSVIPMDFLFSNTMQEILFNGFTLNVWVFAIAWLWMSACSFWGNRRKLFSQQFHYTSF